MGALGNEPGAVFKGRVLENKASRTTTTAGARTVGADEILGGISLRDPNGAARIDTLDTAANIKSALGDAGADLRVGTTMEFTIVNNADAAETITMAVGTGITARGTATHLDVAQNVAATFLLICTNPNTPTFDLYRI